MRPEKRVTAKSNAAPEEMDGTRLADEATAKLGEQPMGLTQAMPEGPRVVEVIARVLVVLLEGDRDVDLDRRRPDRHVDVERRQAIHDGSIEGRDRHRPQIERKGSAVTFRCAEAMIDKVEIELEQAVAVRHRTRGQATRGHVQRHVPPVVEGRGRGHADLADDLCPHVDGRQRTGGVTGWHVMLRRGHPK